MPISKRAARVESVAPEPKKARVVDPIAEKMEVIKSTLADPECQVAGGESHRETLLASIPHTLTITCEERHEYQTSLAKMVQVVIEAYVADQEVKVSDAQANVDSTEKQSAEAMKEVEASAERVQAQEEEVARCQQAFQVEVEAVKAAEEGLEFANKEVADFDANLQITIDEKDEYSSVYNECFIPLKSNSVEKKEVSQHLKRMESKLKKLGTESSLLNAIVPALKKTSEERGPFDIMSVEGIEAVFTKHLESLQQQIATADVSKAEKVAAQNSAQEALTVVKGKEANCEQLLKEAKETLSSLEAGHQQLYQNLESVGNISMKAITEHGIKEEVLTKARDVLTTFNELFERKTVVDSPPEETMGNAENMHEVPESIQVA